MTDVSKMDILIKTSSGRSVTVKIESSETINYVNVKMQEIALDDGEKQLEDREEGDGELEYRFGSTIHETQPINVKMVAGKTLRFFVERSSTINELKAMIEEVEGVPKAKQCLIFGAKQLEDDLTIGDYSIHKDSTIHLVTRRGC